MKLLKLSFPFLAIVAALLHSRASGQTKSAVEKHQTVITFLNPRISHEWGVSERATIAAGPM